MWRIAGSVILVLLGLFAMAGWIYQTFFMAVNPIVTHGQDLRAALLGLILVGVGVGQSLKLRWSWINMICLIAGSAVLIFYGGRWISSSGALGVLAFRVDLGTTVATGLTEAILIAAPGLIALVVGVGQLIEKLIIWRRNPHWALRKPLTEARRRAWFDAVLCKGRQPKRGPHPYLDMDN